MMKRIFNKKVVSILLLVFSAKINAQQIFRVSQVQQHNFLYNPAAAGAASTASVGVSYRKQWAGIDGGPETAILYGDKYFDKKRIGIGVAMYNDKTGPTSRGGGQVNISYSIPMKNESRMMFGIGANVMQYRINKASFASFIPNDPLLASDGTEVKGDAAFGVYYNSKTLNLGVSVQQLMQTELGFINTNTNPQGKLYRHFFAIGSYNIRTDETNVLVPNFVYKFLPNAPSDFEAGIRLEHDNLFWVGLNVHRNQSYTALLGINVKKNLAIGYAFDNYKTPLSIFDKGGGAHEFTMKFSFNK